MTKMKDGIVKRGSGWSYVIRVPNAGTGETRRTWVSGFPHREGSKDSARRGAGGCPSW